MTTYERPPLLEQDRLFAKRVRAWMLRPEDDPELMREIENGKWPELMVLLENIDERE
jgi:hypothetical protein